MAVNQYWVGNIPSIPISIRINDALGYPLNLSNYTFNVRLLGSDNEEIDTSGSTLLTAGASSGRLVFRWPTDRSLFNKSGEYLMQVELYGPGGTRDSTSTHTIKVRRLGGIN